MSAVAGGVRLFLCGDVMTGRGIDQLLPHPVPPHLFEAHVQSATGYVRLAEARCGPLGRQLEFGYPWGDALAVLEAMQPALRIVNLETAVTVSEDAQAGKGIHYRMHPAAAIAPQRQPGDLVVLSIHWGDNWCPAVPPAHREFARELIESGAVDVVHGHSSHHVLPFEIIGGKLVLYGCGDFINDYEGIAGHEAFRPDLALMYFPRLARASGKLDELLLVAMRRRGLRLERADAQDAALLAGMLQSPPFEGRIALRPDGVLALAG